MQKKLTAAVVAGAVVLGGGAAVAVPAFADSSTSADSKPANLADAIKQALKGLVDDKTLTQEQADKVAEKLSQPGAIPGRGFGHRWLGGPGGVHAELDAAAKVLGMSAEDVRAALRGGSTLADLANKQGKSEDTLINALVAAAKTQLAGAVKSGRLTQARADEIQKDLPARIKQMVENGRGGFGPGMRGPGGLGKGGRGPSQEGGRSPGQDDESSTPAPSGSSNSSTAFVTSV